jgi:hypothetical protein
MQIEVWVAVLASIAVMQKIAMLPSFAYVRA